MPHLNIEYSANLESVVDIAALCEAVRAAAARIDAFPTAGIRVRAFRADHYAMADGNPDYGFIDISVRLRGGRPLEVRKEATQTLFAAVRTFLAGVIDSHPIAVSLEMRDIDPELSPKLNTIRKFMTGEA